MTVFAAVPGPLDPFAPILPPDSDVPASGPEIRDPPPKGPPG